MLQGLRKANRHASIQGDIIESVNGKEVTNNNDLFKILDLCKEGDKVWLCFHFFDVLMCCVCVLGGGWCEEQRQRWLFQNGKLSLMTMFDRIKKFIY